MNMEGQTTTFISAEINEISAALSAFQSELKQPELSKEVSVKTRTGSSYTFKYADLSTCVKAAVPTMSKHGLAVTQIISNGTLVTMLTHKSGQWFRSEITIGQPSDYQALGSAITYLKRYTYCAILGIVADTDDDANAACGNQATFKEPTSKRTTKKATGANAVAFTGSPTLKPQRTMRSTRTYGRSIPPSSPPCARRALSSMMPASRKLTSCNSHEQNNITQVASSL